MTKSTFSKWTLGIIGTVFLGALGSGLWDVALKTVFTAAGRGVLTAISFGYGSIRDSYYLEIAKGHTDRASLWLVFFSIMPLIGAISFYIAQSRGRRQAQIEADQEKEQMRADPIYREKRLKGISEELEALKRKLVVLDRITVLLAVFLLSILMFRSITLSYISSAITHYEQSFTICLPFLSETERSSIRSQFAQIKTKDDYIRVLQRIQDVATSHSVSLPKYTPW